MWTLIKILDIIIIDKLLLNTIIDGTDFAKYDYYECEDRYDTKDSLVSALSACRLDIRCAMIGSSSCSDTSEYYLCEKNTNITKNDDACTYRKKSKYCN